MSVLQAVLLLADGRFPTGGHAHSGGVESAVGDGRVRGVADLAVYVRGRLETVGVIDAALAAATVHRLAQPGATAGAVLAELDVEAEARILAPPLRAASRRLGKQLLRAAARCWPAGELVTLADEFPRGAHQNVALGAVVSAVGGSPADAAALAVHHAVTMPAQSAVRLLGLDPFAVAALIAELEPLAATVVAAAADGCGLPLAELPAPSSPLVDIVAVHHATADVRLFAT